MYKIGKIHWFLSIRDKYKTTSQQLYINYMFQHGKGILYIKAVTFMDDLEIAHFEWKVRLANFHNSDKSIAKPG